jgi:hypothetical protein
MELSMFYKLMNLPLLLSCLFYGITASAADQSQTLIRFSGGLIQTLPAVTVPNYSIYVPGVKAPTVVKDAALLYDKRNPLPTIAVMGTNYAFLTNGTMVTVSDVGSLYYKGKTPYQPSVIGGNYFLNKGTNELIMVDSAGFYISTAHIAPKIRLLGGNFYIDQAGVLTTIKHQGAIPGITDAILTVKNGWDFNSATLAGGNFFFRVDGSLVGINSENGNFVDYQKPDAWPKKIGGNYFIGTDNVLYTVSNKGFLMKWQPVIGEMKRFGYSYMIDLDNDFIFVDGKGVPHTSMVRVSSTGVQSEVTNKISLMIEDYNSFVSQKQ